MMSQQMELKDTLLTSRSCGTRENFAALQMASSGHPFTQDLPLVVHVILMLILYISSKNLLKMYFLFCVPCPCLHVCICM